MMKTSSHFSRASGLSALALPFARKTLRALAPALLIALWAAGCARAEPQPIGQLEITLETPRTRTCEGATAQPRGSLFVRRLDEAAGASFSAEDLATGRTIRHQLPAGLYSLSWAPGAAPDGMTPPGRWRLRGAGVVSVAPGRVTRLLVSRDGASCETGSQAAAPRA